MKTKFHIGPTFLDAKRIRHSSFQLLNEEGKAVAVCDITGEDIIRAAHVPEITWEEFDSFIFLSQASQNNLIY
jgi:hypothetical protein